MKLICTVLLLCGAAWGQDADAGKAAFEKYGCYTCHGHLGQGTAAGPRLGPDPIPEAALIAYVRQPTGGMPPYTAKVVTDQELRNIRAYLASVPAPRPVRDIPELNQ